MRRVFSALLLLASIGGSRAASAGVTVNINPGPGSEFARQAGLRLEDLDKQIATQIDQVFQTYRVHDFLRAFGDAQAFSTRGLGVDYASNLQFLMVGVAGNVSLNADKGFVPGDTQSRPAVAALSSNLTFMGGLNLGFLGASPVTLFGNYFKGSGHYEGFSSDLQNWGAHVQIKLFGPRRRESAWNALVKWGGFDITSGFDYARTTLSLGQQLKRTFPIGMVGAENPTVLFDGMGLFDLDMRTWSVPLEVTTNLRFLYVLTLFGGLGFDWQLGGGSDMKLDLASTLTGRSASIPAQDLGTATVTANDSVVPSRGRLRGMLGLQVNLWLFRVFVQLNAVPNPASASLAFGLRLAY